MKQICLMILLFVSSMNVGAQSFQKTQQGIKTVANGNEVAVQFYSPSIIRVTKTPTGKTFVKQSLSVVLTPSKTPFTTKQTGNIVAVKSDKVTVSVDLTSGAVEFLSASGQALLKEKTNGTKLTAFDDAGASTYNVYQSFTLDADEPIYGLGQHQRGDLSQRNQNYHLEQGNVEDAVTFFQSVKGYGLFWDNYSPTEFVDNENETSFNSQAGDGVDYYFMYGGSADGVIANMRALTGQAPLFPLWTYGYWKAGNAIKARQNW